MRGLPKLNRKNTSLFDLYHIRGGGGQTSDIWKFMEEVVTFKFSGGSGKLNFSGGSGKQNFDFLNT